MSIKLRTALVLPALLAAASIVAPVPVSSQTTGRISRREHIQGREVAASDVLVRFRPGAEGRMRQIELDLDADDNRPVGAGGWRRIHSASRTAQALLTALSSRADVLEVEPNYIVHTTATIPNDLLFPQLWGLNKILATSAWDAATGSASSVVGVIDSGVDYSHPDLAANMWTAPAAFTVTLGTPQFPRPITCPAGSHGFNAIAFSCDPADDNHHGTHVSGTIGAAGNNSVGVVGVNWTTRIMGLKFLDAGGNGSTADAVDAIDFAIQTKAIFAATKAANVRVLSNSWGGDAPSSALQQAIQRAATADILFVAAAGNANSNNDAAPFYPASYTTSNVVAVAATDSDDSRASFSNWGATSVDLAAPGVSILSTWWPGGGYAGVSGTSMATPHVAGAAALVLSGCVLTTTQLKTALLNNVDIIPAFTGLVVTNGRLNVDRALRSCATLPVVSLTSPSEGATFTAPATITLASTATDPEGISRVEFYQGTTLIGTSTTNPYGGTWSAVPAGIYTLTAKAYDNLGVRSTSAAVHVTVTDSGGPRLNVALASNGGVAVASSTANSNYPASATINGDRKGVGWGAGGGWNDGTADVYPDWLEVDFNGTHAIDEIDVFTLQDNYTAPSDPTAGMTFTCCGVRDFDVQYWNGTSWQTVAGGSITGNTKVWRTITFPALSTTKIRVFVTNALSSYSRIVEVEAYQSSGSANTPPTVSLTSPTEGASFAVSTPIGLAAMASDSDGTVKRVDFYANGTLVGNDLTNPYTFTWTPTVAGPYTLTAVATDNLDVPTTSAAVHVTVTGSGRPNIALASAGAVAVASSTANSNYPASAAINGDRKGVGWGAGGGWNDGTAEVFPDWLEVDFSGARTIDEIDVFTLQDNYTAPIDPTAAMTFTCCGLRDFDVQYWNGASWQTVAGGSITGNNKVWRTLTFPAVSTTRIRVLVTNALASYSRIVEVEAYQSSGSANMPPTVSLTSPTEGASFAVSTPVGLAAMAGDADGTVKRVDFYANGTLVGSDLTNPYTVTWTPTVAGPYTLTAVATDNLDVPTTSAAVHVTVTGGRTNVALASTGAVAVGSSTANSNYPASGAINGDRKGLGWGAGGGWNDGTSGVFPDWLEVDFNGTHTIDEIDVFTLQDNYTAPIDPTAGMTFTGYGLRDFEVQYWNGTTWLTVAGGSITGNSNVWRTITFPAVSTTRIRVFVTNALSSYSRIVEVEAYE